MERTDSGNERQRLMETFLKRSYVALQRMVESAPTSDLMEALAAPTDIGGVMLLLSEVGALQPEWVALDPLVELQARGTMMKQEMIREAGGAYSTGEVAKLLGITRQGVQQRARRGALLALTIGQRERYYPTIQFDSSTTVAGLEKVLAAFNIDDPWSRLSLLLDKEESLGGRRVIDALRDGDLEPVLRVVRSFAA